MNAPLDAARLADEACAATGCDDWGQFDVLGPLAALVDSLNREAGLNPLGHLFARERLATLLATRLKVVARRKADPGIADEEIVRPIIIPSLPRTGTTVLFNLLAQDPDNRVPLGWEVLLSDPPPTSAAYHSDPRIDEAQALIDRWGLTRPEIYAIHPLGARLADECVFLCEQWMVNTPFGAFWNVPGYAAATAGVDKVSVFAEHRKLLQHLQRGHAGKRWLLKAPSHLSQLAALTAVYPDAVFVQTHRDLRKILPSYASLFSTLRRTWSDDPANWNAPAMLRANIPALRERLEKAAEFREDAPQTFIDVLYADLLADPMAVVRRIYRELGIALVDETAARMEAWLAANGKGSHGTPDYSEAQAVIAEYDIDALFGDYMARYGVPREG